MSDQMDFQDWLKSLPTATDMTGMTLLAKDSQGNIKGVDAALLVDWLTATKQIPKIVRLQVGSPMDANTLTTQGCTIYVPNGDMSGHHSDFLNFPGNKPEGGFSLISIKEGNWQRQIYMRYNNHNVFVRSSIYSSNGEVFKDWKIMIPEEIQ